MNKKKSYKRFKKDFERDILKKFTASFIVFSCLTIILYLAVAFFAGFRIWQPDDPLYIFLYFFKRNRYFVFPAVILLIAFILFRKYLRFAIGYLQLVADAANNIDDDKLLELPDELSEIENSINSVKLSIKEKERIYKLEEQKKNDLIVYLAHDLKTPLTSVIGYITLLNDEKDLPLSLKDKYLSIALNKALRLEDLINEFFEITRFNLSNIDLELSTIDLKIMLEQTVFEFKPMLLDKHLSCNLVMDDSIQLKCDPDKIQRVFDNLIRNAVNYSFDNTDIDIIVNGTKDRVDIRIENKGPTIPKDKLQRIFEQFYRLDYSRSTKSGGAGLGLAIAKQIVELHGGSISVESYDEKVEFLISLPVL